MSKETPVCGIIMPISSIDGCGEAHWADVRSILDDAIISAGFSPKIVSMADDIGVIQKRIVQNLYDNPVVVCDVSGKNPNVMFELGMRLAFDKPTVIVKDDKTGYSFDTGVVEHVEYPRDLRFSKIVEFKEELSKKIKNTISNQNGNSTFLKSFGDFKIAKIDKKEVSESEYFAGELKEMRYLLESVLGGRSSVLEFRRKNNPDKLINICLRDATKAEISRAISIVDVYGDRHWIENRENGHVHVFLDASSLSDAEYYYVNSSLNDLKDGIKHRKSKANISSANIDGVSVSFK